MYALVLEIRHIDSIAMSCASVFETLCKVYQMIVRLQRWSEGKVEAQSTISTADLWFTEFTARVDGSLQ